MKKISIGLILIISIFFLVGCTDDPKESLIENLEKGNYAKVVQIYNSEIIETEQEDEMNGLLENEINGLVDRWDSEEIDIDYAASALEELSSLETIELSKLASENAHIVDVEGNGRLLHIEAEEYYAEDKLAEAMKCVLDMDPEYSLYDNAQELYDTSEKVILESVSTPYSSEDCYNFIEQLDEYMSIVENQKFAKKKAEIEKKIDEYVIAEGIVDEAAKLYDNKKYKKCFAVLSDSLKKYPNNNLLPLALENSHSLYVIQVTQTVLELCENEEYKEALDEVNVGIEIYECEEFLELRDSIRKMKSLTYRISSSIVEKFEAFTQDGEGETLTVKEVGSKAGAYVVKSGEKLVLGDYSKQEATLLSFTGGVVASITAVDVISDLRDLSYDVTHWGEEEYFLVFLAADTIALLPVIGAIKYFDLKTIEKTADAMKHVSNVVDGSKSAEKMVDVTDTIIDANKKYKNVGEAVENAKEFTVLKTIKNKQVRYVTKPTRNARYKGKVHPAGVKFSEKKLKYSNGSRELRVVPEFDYVYEVQLDKGLYMAEESVHFKECNKQLKQAIKKNSNLRKQFTADQIEEIENGIKGNAPSGYTWHHNEREGVLQLVETEIHQKVGHTGGYSMWGAGSLKDAS